jgi:hypothetical protein
LEEIRILQPPTRQREFMNASIELHDSTVARIEKTGETVTVDLQPAYVHKSEGRAGIDRGTGWAQRARLIFENAIVGGTQPNLPCRIMDGELVVGEVKHDNLIPVPPNSTSPTTLHVVFDSLHDLTVTASCVRIEFLVEPSYVEEFIP